MRILKSSSLNCSVPDAMKFCVSPAPETFGPGNRFKRLTAWEDMRFRGIWLFVN